MSVDVHTHKDKQTDTLITILCIPLMQSQYFETQNDQFSLGTRNCHYYCIVTLQPIKTMSLSFIFLYFNSSN